MAIADGADALPINAKIKALEQEQEQAASADRLKALGEEQPLLHPALAAHYCDQVAHLENALRAPEGSREAFELVRSLIEEVRLTPEEGQLQIELRGDLAGILALSEAGAKGQASPEAKALQIKLVAGAGFEPTTFRL